MITRLVNMKILGKHLNINIRRYAIEPHRCDAHMNELPVPCGPWDAWYKKKQEIYKKFLVFGVLWFIFSFSLTMYTGAIFLNWGPPAQPAPPLDMIEECNDCDT